MPRNQHKKRNESDSDDRHDLKKCYEQPCAAIICCPRDKRESFESDSSDQSCPDFSDLCEDKPKICCEKKDLCKDKKNKKDNKLDDLKDKKDQKDESSSSDSDDESSKPIRKQKGKGCQGCGQGCNGCSQCKACGCKECFDFGRETVVSALGGSQSSSECANFEGIDEDRKRICCDLKNPCKKHEKKREKKSPCDNKALESSSESEKKEVIKGESSSSSSSKGKKFIVSFASKEGHPWAEYNAGSDSIHINGKNGPVLHLYRGSTYFFCVEQEIKDNEETKHAFVLTNSPVGGANSRIIQDGFAPVSKGCVCFKVGKNTPRYFFYQDSKNEFEGGLVIVHDK